jgi:dienelactone hydrolase
VLALGNHLVDNGFTVVIPSLYGTPGAPAVRAGALGVIARGCVAKEFAAFATNKDRPISHYLRALARDLNAKTPGRGVGVIGQCFSGGFALAAAVDDSVLAPVMSQPSLPMPLTPRQRADSGVTDAELKIIEKRAADEGLCALGLRFSGDPLVPAERFRTLKDRLGDAFEVIELDSAKGNPAGFGRMAHSVLTLEVRETPGNPAYEARKRVVEFLKERLS